MKSIESRIKNIEDKLHMGSSQQSLFIVIRKHNLNPLPEPIEEWVTYKEAEASCGLYTVFVADQNKELEARENLKQSALTEPVPGEPN